MKVSSHVPALRPWATPERYAVLDVLPETAFDRPVRLAARLLQAPVALLTLGDGEHPWFQSGVGIDPAQTACFRRLCATTLGQPEGLVVPDLAQDARFAADLWSAGGPSTLR